MTAVHDLPLVLVVEDEPRLAQLAHDYLVRDGFTCQQLHEGTEVVDWVREHQPDLLVLDLMLPGRDGLSICQALRSFSDVPIIMVTARVEEVDRLVGLESGADDYVCKPFSPRELVARVKAILRRQRRVPAVAVGASADPATDPERSPEADPDAGLVLDGDRHQARVQGQLLDLTPAEFRLLRALADAPGRVFSRDQLLDKLHDDQRALSDRTIDSHVKNLRRKLELACPGQEPIRSIYGVGYRFDGIRENT
ncbi:response regulator [Roseateles sp. SL47]|uniref:response regulator n=1 Tax=Roseateles sp. SL47 TaxID=2995138 RepID=UPI00226D9A86|nr:response regulator [Roseateles sp. SL47]WAC73234.1 response regulator [Roseateles sp. SL47]